MKKSIIFSAFALAIIAAGCSSDDDRFGSEGIGRLVVSADIKSDVSIASRAASGEDNLRESLILWISNDKGPVRKYNGASSIPDKDWLPSGSYLAEAWAGDSVSATFDADKRWFKGAVPFEIKALETSTVAIPCKIVNVLVDVAFDDDVIANLSDIKVTVGHKRGQLEYGVDSTTGYFMMPSSDKDLQWTLSAVRADGAKVEKSGTIANARPATLYTLSVRSNPVEEQIGGAIFDIKVDTYKQEVYHDIIIEIAPIISGYGFELGDELVFKQGEVGARSVVVSASAALTSAKMSVSGLSQLLGGLKDKSGADFDMIDFMTASDDIKNQIETAGIYWNYDYDAVDESSLLKVNFQEKFTDNLPVGDYEFINEITDAKGRVTRKTVVLHISNAPLRINATTLYNVWATKATVTADIVLDDYGTAAFEYRKAGDASWTRIAATATPQGDAVSAEITDLSPATTYEYRVVSDLNDFASAPMTFTTETAAQLPNAGFENWYQNGKPWLPYGENDSPFWDSGNHGSTALSANSNVCVAATDIVHSGSKSAHLVTRYVVVKLAAGNIFVGEYLATDGTNGVLGWGRQFNSRPKALKGYVKYKSVAVNRGTPSNIPGSPIASGDNDQGIIYVAVLDNSITKTYEGKSYPVIVKTKTTELFSSADSNVLGYGEKVWTESTAGEGMIPFEIPIDYSGRPQNAPAYIVVTCSSSRYGDYFVGGEGSEMWIDDLEFVY